MKKIPKFLILAIMFLGGTAETVEGLPKGHREMMLEGPWEIVVQVGNQKSGIAFAVSVEDENIGQKMNTPLPIMKTPVKVKLVEYVPDLQWLISAEENKKGQSVALLAISGLNLNQQVWLDSSDDKKKAVSSGNIGSVAIKHLYSREVLNELKEKLKNEKTVGLLALWSEKSDKPFEFAVAVGDTVKLPDTKYSFKVLRYVPHYSIDTETKKVSSASDMPVNPAIELEVTDGNDTFRQWLWSKFESPHMVKKLPFKAVFNDFDLREPGNYIIASAPGGSSEIFFVENKKIATMQVPSDEKFVFANPDYVFKVNELHHEAVIKKDMRKNSGELLNPAIIATIEYAKTESQAVLEFNKPHYHVSESGSMSILFRKKIMSSEQTE